MNKQALQKTLSFFSWVGGCSGAGRRKLAGAVRQVAAACALGLGRRRVNTRAPAWVPESSGEGSCSTGRSESPGRRLHRRPWPLAERPRLSHPAELRVCDFRAVPPTRTCRALTSGWPDLRLLAHWHTGGTFKLTSSKQPDVTMRSLAEPERKASLLALAGQRGTIWPGNRLGSIPVFITRGRDGHPRSDLRSTLKLPVTSSVATAAPGYLQIPKT